MLSRVAGKPSTLHINRTAVITKNAAIRLQVTLKGKPSQGAILIRRVSFSAGRATPHTDARTTPDVTIKENGAGNNAVAAPRLLRPNRTGAMVRAPAHGVWFWLP